MSDYARALPAVKLTQESFLVTIYKTLALNNYVDTLIQ